MSLVISEELFTKLLEFTEFENRSNEDLDNALRKRITKISRIYNRGGFLVIWGVLDRFALHVISTNRVLDSGTLRKAVGDLEKCELKFDTMDEGNQQTLRVFQTHFCDALITPKQKEFELAREKLVAETNHEMMLYLLERVIKPSTIDREKLEDRLVEEVWSKLTNNFNEDFIRKRMKRVKGIVAMMQSKPPKQEEE